IFGVCIYYLRKINEDEEYYLIMMAGWLLCECIIRYQEKSLIYLEKYNINPKMINKGIQKCRESLRLSKETKDYLLKYKVALKNKR
ncbi:MAG: hypothetical protein WC152_08990, partial [Candidatus Izemoplasmatales bacterium]